MTPVVVVFFEVESMNCLADRRRQADARPVAGQRLRHALVGDAHRRALGIELRIVLIGLGQRAADGVGPSPDAGPAKKDRARNRGERKTDRPKLRAPV